MITERLWDRPNTTRNSAEIKTPSDAVLDLFPFRDKNNFREAICFLNKARARFDEENWKGGLEINGWRQSIEDVGKTLVDINRGRGVTVNSLLATAEAFNFAGVEIKEDLLVYLRKKAHQEVKNIQAAKKEVEARERTESLRRKLKIVASAGAISLIPIAVALAAKPWEAYLPVQVGPSVGNNNDPVAAEISPLLFETSQEDVDRQEAGRTSWLSGIGESIESIVVKPPPLVAELGSERDEPFHLWRFNFADKETGATFEWNYSGVVDANGGIPISFTVRPQSYSDRKTSSYSCLNDIEQDCLFFINGTNTLTIHTNWVADERGSAQDWGYFIEGGSKEEPNHYFSEEVRSERTRLLEQDGVTLIQGNHEARAEVAIVRVEQGDKQKIYNDLSQALAVALEYDPDIGTRVNLDKPFLVALTCGRLLPGDKRSGDNENITTSSVYVFVIGEALTD